MDGEQDEYSINIMHVSALAYSAMPSKNRHVHTKPRLLLKYFNEVHITLPLSLFTVSSGEKRQIGYYHVPLAAMNKTWQLYPSVILSWFASTVIGSKCLMSYVLRWLTHYSDCPMVHAITNDIYQDLKHAYRHLYMHKLKQLYFRINCPKQCQM